MDKIERCTTDCLKKMFKMVGEKFPNDALTKQSEWYTKRTWTQAKEDEFRAWMRKRVKKSIPYLTDIKIENEIGMFLLMWGWRVKEEE